VAMALPFGIAVVASQGRVRGRFAASFGVLLAELLFVAVTRARGAWLGGALGIAAYVAIRRPALPTRTRLLLLPGVAVVLAAALLPGRWRARDANDIKRYEPGARVVLDALDPASPVARTRLGLWRRTLAVYGEHPLTGVGPGNFAVLFPRHAEPGAAADGVMSATMIPRRPHNEWLERLAETGPLGLAAFAALFIAAFMSALAIARRARARGADDALGDLDAASAAAGSVAACLGCGLTAFPLAMPGTVLLFGVSLGVLDALAPAKASAVADAAAPAARFPLARALAAPMAVVLVLGAGWLSVGVLASSYLRGRARAALVRGGDARANAASALALLERAARLPRLDQVRFDIALRAAQVAVRIGRGEAALQEADRALAIEPYSPHAWAARAAAQLALGNEGPAVHDATRAMTLFLDLPSARTTLETVRKLDAARAEPSRGIDTDVNIAPVGGVGP
jgi:tetratricopeptide (TPR) repeat protein